MIFEVGFRVRTLKAIRAEIDVPNYTSMKTIDREEARWGVTGKVIARQRSSSQGTDYVETRLYHVVHDGGIVTGAAWYYEDELELEVAGSPHVDLVVDLLGKYDPDKAKVFADVCAERGLTGASFHLQKKEPSAETRFAIETLAMAMGVSGYRIFVAMTADWKRGWLEPEDGPPAVRRNAFLIEEGQPMPSGLRHALLPAAPAEGENRHFRATGKFLRISGNGTNIIIPGHSRPVRSTASPASLEELVIARGTMIALAYDGKQWNLLASEGTTPFNFPDVLTVTSEAGVSVPRSGRLAAIYEPLRHGEDSLAVFVNRIYRPGWNGMQLEPGNHVEVRYGQNAPPAFNNLPANGALLVIERPPRDDR